MMRLSLTVPVMILAVLFFASAALAQEAMESSGGGTPDSDPPSVETVCDTFSGAAFGLCNAFCEAMDCELAEDTDPDTNPAASAIACDKVRNKFVQLTDEEPPCLPALCPCAGLPQWEEALTGACASWDFPVYNCGCGTETTCSNSFDPFRWIHSVDNATGGSCGPTDVRYWCGETGSSRDPWTIIEITGDQHLACSALIVDACTP